MKKKKTGIHKCMRKDILWPLFIFHGKTTKINPAMPIPLNPFCSEFFTLSFSNVRHLRVHKSLPQIDSVDTESEATTFLSCKLNDLIKI